MRCRRMSPPGSGPPDMPRDPEMSAWTPDQEPDDDEDWRLLKGLLVGVPLAILCWFGILWATPRIWAWVMELML